MLRKEIRCILPFLIVPLLLSSCARSMYKVDGISSITSFDGRMLSLKAFDPNGQWEEVDSAEVVHGFFNMEGPADSVMMVTLYLDDEGLMPLVLEGGRIKVTLSNEQLTAGGTPLNDALYEFIGKRNSLELKLDEVSRKEARMVLDGGNLEDIRKQLDKENEALLKEMDNCVKSFIADNEGNVLGPGVFLMLCSTLPYPMMTPQIEDIMRTVTPAFKENVFVKDFLSKAKENMQLIEEQKRLSPTHR